MQEEFQDDFEKSVSPGSRITPPGQSAAMTNFRFPDFKLLARLSAVQISQLGLSVVLLCRSRYA